MNELYRQRIGRLAVVFGLLGLVLLLVAGHRLIWRADEIGQTRFQDQHMLDQIRRLAERGVIRPGGEGEEEVVIDLEELRAAVANPWRRRYIMARQPYYSFSAAGFEVDPAAVAVSNRRLVREASFLLRGRILDRNGRVLAETVTGPDGRQRHYPLGPAALPLLGLAHPVYGLKGLERDLSPLLEGTGGESMPTRLYRFFAGRQKINDVLLTVDAEVQEAAFAALAGRAGAVVALDVRSGEILAAAAGPSFDPARPPGVAWDEADAMGRQSPFRNRAWQRRYPPGSIFKLVTAAALLEKEGAEALSRSLVCQGRHPRLDIRNYQNKRHGKIDLDGAMVHSCNVYFADIGAELGPAVGEMAARFGFNRAFSPGGDLPPTLVSPAFGVRPEGGAAGAEGPWQEADYRHNPKLVAQGAIGQNVVEATPLQVAMIGAALANDGKLVPPRLLRATRHPAIGEEGEVSPPFWIGLGGRAEEAWQVCDKATARALLAMMGRVMADGTGANIPVIYRMDGVYKTGKATPAGTDNVLAGKTGTAQVGGGRQDHAWFLAVAPMPKPRYAVVALIEHGGLGAKEAGPVAVATMLALLNR